MLAGQLWATSDLNMAMQCAANGFRIIYLGDSLSIEPQHKNMFIAASSLVPGYEILSYQIDGNMDAFINSYVDSLNTPPAVEMMSIILACLYKGTNIVFYVPQDALGLNYVQYLLQFINFNYGITTQTKNTQYSFNPAFMGRILELLYLHQLIDNAEFLMASNTLDEITLRRLVSEYRPNLEDPKDVQSIIKWFSNLKDSMIKENKPLINGIQYAGDEEDYGCF